VGVNLPAHTVVIKGTMSWGGPIVGFREYSDIEIQVSSRKIGLAELRTANDWPSRSAAV
jgi:hypothetical protein